MANACVAAVVCFVLFGRRVVTHMYDRDYNPLRLGGSLPGTKLNMHESWSLAKESLGESLWFVVRLSSD
uniref:Putative secreted protein n=1 Tax=Anopheles marajoara TaxID=58244 RepID=A0A2M4CF27_9DIPT